MTDYYCGFCNNKFWNKSNLDKHQKTAKYCLDIQSKSDPLVGKINNNIIVNTNNIIGDVIGDVKVIYKK